MADWIVCPACRLKHVARPDGACPRCKQPIDGAAAMAPSPAANPAGASAALPAERSEAVPAGARIAAWVLYANVLVAILVLLITGTKPSDPAGIGNVGTIIVDVVLATSLVQGKAKYVGWAIGRAVLGALILTPILWSNAGPALGIVQLLYCLGLVLLLVGDPGVARIVAGLVPSAGALMLVVAIVASHGTARRVNAVVADLLDRGVHLDRVEHAEGRWRLPLPEGTWHPGKALKGVDRMVSWPEEDAHLLVLSQTAPDGTELDLFRAADGMIEAMRKVEPSLAEVERRSFRARRGSGIAVRATQTAKGVEVEGWYVVVVDANRLAAAFALAPRERFEDVGETLLGIAEQLEL